MKRMAGQTASGVASKTDVNCCEGSVELENVGGGWIDL